LLRHPTLDQLHALGLHGMAKAFAEITAGGEADGLGHHEWLGLLLDREASWRQDKRLAARAEDPEFTEVVRNAEGNPATKLIAKVHNIDMVPHGPYTTITLTK